MQSTPHQDIEGDVDRNVVHSDQNFTRTGFGGLDVLRFEVLGTTKLTQYDRLHVSLLLGRLLKRLNPACRMLVKHAALHDREQIVTILKNADVGKRIAVDQQYIGELSRFDLP